MNHLFNARREPPNSATPAAHEDGHASAGAIRRAILNSYLMASVALWGLAFSGRAAQTLADSINPMIGASTSTEYGEGKTFPGAATPFGLVQLSPDTITGGDNGPGYSWEHKSIEGFSFTHMSGVGWYGDFGNFQVMPTTGKLKTERGDKGAEDGFRSRFNHGTEVAKAGYYAVTLDDYKIRAEMAAAPRRLLRTASTR